MQGRPIFMICFRSSVPLLYTLLMLISLYSTCRLYKISGFRL